LKSYYDNIMETKICCKCKLNKELSKFGKHKRSKDGLRYECNTCHSLDSKKNREENPEKITNIKKKNYNLNKELSLSRSKLWRKLNPDKFNDSQKQWKLNNKEKYDLYLKTWRSENRESINNYSKMRKQSDPIFRLKTNVRARVYNFLKSKNIVKNNKTFDIVGCTPQFLKEYLENKFTEGMSWVNHSQYGWHIDHIIPLSSAKTEEEIHKLCHYTNLQPLWAKDNLVKGTKLPHFYSKTLFVT